MAKFSVISVFSFFLFSICTAVPEHPYKVGYTEQRVDHFNEMSYHEETFKQKYLYSVDKNWKKGGPIFFYTGNEGPIEGFWEACGFVHELAVEAKALVIFAEHRYYGASLPFGNKSFKVPQLGLLTIEQAMADYAVLLTEFTKMNNSTNSKIIAFGGSYGGMLAAYMRFKYPNLIYGSLASSAPIYMQDPTVSNNFFFEAVTEVFKKKSFTCYQLTKGVFSIMDMFASEGSTGLHSLTKYFNLCKPLANLTEYNRFLGWIRNAFVMISMYDYPYSVGNMPAYPVTAACHALSNHNPIKGLGNLAAMYYNNTSNKKCFDISAEFMECADPTGCGVGNDAIAWDYQACTEVRLPSGSNDATDMFPKMPWTDEIREKYCLKTYGVKPRPYWPSIQFWGQNIESTSNIIFSNGNLDPWRNGGVPSSVTDSIVSILIEGGAHHLDLRGSNKNDPISVVEVREKEKAIIRKWLSES